MGEFRSFSHVLDSEKEITRGLLDAVHRDSGLTQRTLASRLGIALGLANAYLKRCVKKGYIKVTSAPANRYAYYLTPQGFAEKTRLTAEYFTQSFNFFRLARDEGAELLRYCAAQGWRRVALYGRSDLAEILTLCARDQGVELAAVVVEENGDGRVPESFAGLPVVASLDAVPGLDAVIVADLGNPQGTFERLRTRFRDERVLVPPFLEVVRGPSPAAAGEGAS
jgi:DNA-binding MarR family transcriptional regulator